ncbi:Hypothetical protein SRAE_1000106500 [Strongyloides ratti]|uniref:Uncharacterized protein n=1 Tax=Strongyloides ratti TaxID=34506 RepID=A0A090KZE7_STRRB|nr:Hypothetical protein SRAE_1000106500 [Strongyloides ratti]CEF62796.1 Hypothetical protein SRAE_1000106500 [Strongyloides ratti]
MEKNMLKSGDFNYLADKVTVGLICDLDADLLFLDLEVELLLFDDFELLLLLDDLLFLDLLVFDKLPDNEHSSDLMRRFLLILIKRNTATAAAIRTTKATTATTINVVLSVYITVSAALPFINSFSLSKLKDVVNLVPYTVS